MSNRSLLQNVSRSLAAAAALLTVAGTAMATPSTQVWIPSTDVQAFKTIHLNVDSYIRTKNNPDGSRTPTAYVLGPTVGVSPFEKVQAEVGFDLIYVGYDGVDAQGNTVKIDSNPFYGHAKIATPEGALFAGSPAIAVGGYNFGTRKDVTDANISYGQVAKTVPVLGRLSAGYYTLNGKSWVAASGLDANGNDGDDHGVLLAWDRTMSEISDKLWLAVDYQGGDNAYGALSFGAAWAFAKNVSVIFGYDVYNDKARAGQNTATVQVDINFP